MNTKFIMGLTLSFSQVGLAAIKKEPFYIHQVKPIVVAVIDTGVDVDHPELKDYIWTNEGETGKDIFGNDKENNGIDDDDNGFVDDLHGWNFVDNTNRIDDMHGHGTHISAIIKNEYKNRSIDKPRSTWPAPVRLMILKYFDPNGKNTDNMLYSTRAIAYAKKMKANIINYSGGGGGRSETEFLAIKETERAGILFVAAAGNSKSNTDVEKYYPANYGLKNIISVAAATGDGDLVPFSNFGKQSVDIVAPGKSILSALPHKLYGVMSGTSQATAFVSGAAAKILATGPERMKPEQVIKELLKKSHLNKSLVGKTKHQLALINE